MSQRHSGWPVGQSRSRASALKDRRTPHLRRRRTDHSASLRFTSPFHLSRWHRSASLPSCSPSASLRICSNPPSLLSVQWGIPICSSSLFCHLGPPHRPFVSPSSQIANQLSHLSLSTLLPGFLPSRALLVRGLPASVGIVQRPSLQISVAAAVPSASAPARLLRASARTQKARKHTALVARAFAFRVLPTDLLYTAKTTGHPAAPVQQQRPCERGIWR